MRIDNRSLASYNVVHTFEAQKSSATIVLTLHPLSTQAGPVVKPEHTSKNRGSPQRPIREKQNRSPDLKTTLAY